jgi:hypothetical protein
MPTAQAVSVVARRSSKVAWREIEGEIVIISPEDSSVHELNETAGAFWRQADGRRDLSEIARNLAMSYDAPLDTVLADIEDLVAELCSKRLLTVEKAGA